MKALVKERPGPGLSLLEIEVPRIERADDVLFRVEYCAICVGEVKVFDWNEWAEADATLKLPTVLGHEASGVVVEVGSAVEQFRPGDRVVPDPFIYCGRCYQCRAGHTNMCVEAEIYGKRRGAFAKFAILPERALCPLPDGLKLEEGALLENLGIAVHAVEQVPHEPGETAVVIGAGPIGLLAAQTLTASGARVVVADKREPRLQLAAASGLRAVDVGRENLRKTVLTMTSGRGADFVLEAAASQAAFDCALEVVRPRGTIVTIGTFDAPITFNPFFTMTRREVRLLSSIGRTWETWRRMGQLIESGKVALSPLISQILPLDQFQTGFDLVKSLTAMKVLLKP